MWGKGKWVSFSWGGKETRRDIQLELTNPALDLLK